MNTRLFSLAASLILSVSGATMAQAATNPDASQAAPSVASSAVGRWLYDAQGHTIGSVRNLTDQGRTAVIMVGSYFQPGSHEAKISSSMLSVTGGKVTLRPGAAEALNTVARQ